MENSASLIVLILRYPQCISLGSCNWQQTLSRDSLSGLSDPGGDRVSHCVAAARALAAFGFDAPVVGELSTRLRLRRSTAHPPPCDVVVDPDWRRGLHFLSAAWTVGSF